MILGRSTIQWTSLISAAAGLIQLIVVTLMPEIDPTIFAQVLGGIVIFLGVAIAFIANTSTTPIDDPRLKVNTPVTVVNRQGAIVGHTKVQTPPETSTYS